MTWQSLTQSMEEACEYVKYVDSKGVDQLQAMSPITCSVPELGTFLKMDDSALVDVLISMWDGQLENWGHKTKSSGNIEIKNPWLNLLACTTPSWLEQHFPTSMIGGGLTSRIMFIYGDKKRHLVAYPDEQTPEDDYYAHRQLLVEDLQRIALLSGNYALSPAARKWGTRWYEALWSRRPTDMANDRYSGYISRKQTHIHKVAMVLAAAQRESLVVEEQDLIDADALLASIEPDMIKVFESVGVVDEAKNIANIVAHVKAYSWIDPQQLFNLLRNNISDRDYKNAIKIALEQGLLSVEVRNAKRGLTMPKHTTH